MDERSRGGDGLDRRAVVAAILKGRDDLLVVTGLGSPSYDVHAAGDRDSHFYLWGAMGSAALVGLGLAQAQPGRPVLAITGDGEQLMGLGGLATIAVAKPANLSVLVLDNGHYGETGMQRSHTAFGVNLAGVAVACGFASVLELHEPADVAQAAEALKSAADGPRLYVAKVAPDAPPRSLPIRDAVQMKNRTRAHLGFGPN